LKQRDVTFIRECPIYDFRSINYPKCLAVAPGFISPNNLLADADNTGNLPGRAGAASTHVKNTITETPVYASFYYTKTEQMGAYTGTIVKMCPEFSRLFMATGGGWNEDVACRIGAPGANSCQDNDSDYCIDG
jgi:hypothetical protein